jgi:3-(3-hydroxy-phenyl)propionate hydroxylase
MTDHAVVVVGAGPTGLMLAGELALAGADVAIVERRAGQDLVGSRAGGLLPRTLELLDQRGIADRFISQGRLHKAVHFYTPLDLADLPTRHNYVLGLWQNETERILADWVGELGVAIHRGREVAGCTQDDDGVEIELSDGKRVRAEYLVGCDGGRSLVRRAAGIDFPGWEPTTSWLNAEVSWSREPEWGLRNDATGTHAIARLEDENRARVVLTERRLEDGEPTLRDVSEALTAVYGTDYGVHSPTWISRFTDAARQAAAYRDRRVLLAGDAAHVHPPMGGQGLNTGVQDAVNLGWKLAQVVKRISPESLLVTYHAERHPVAARVLRNTLARAALGRPDDRSKALAGYVAEFLGMDEPRRRMVGELSGLDVHYNSGEGHPLLGRRMPDLDLVTPNGPVRVFALLHDARGVVLDFGGLDSFDITPWSASVRMIPASHEGDWNLPAIGLVPRPTAVLMRPDGYVAWVGDKAVGGLAESLTTWFGPPATP